MSKSRMFVAMWALACAGVIGGGANGYADSATDARAHEVCEADAGMFFPDPIVPPGACILPSGNCVVTLDTICRISGGAFQGANTQCE